MNTIAPTGSRSTIRKGDINAFLWKVTEPKTEWQLIREQYYKVCRRGAITALSRRFLPHLFLAFVLSITTLGNMTHLIIARAITYWGLQSSSTEWLVLLSRSLNIKSNSRNVWRNCLPSSIYHLLLKSYASGMMYYITYRKCRLVSHVFLFKGELGVILYFHYIKYHKIIFPL